MPYAPQKVWSANCLNRAIVTRAHVPRHGEWRWAGRRRAARPGAHLLQLEGCILLLLPGHCRLADAVADGAAALLEPHPQRRALLLQLRVLPRELGLDLDVRLLLLKDLGFGRIVASEIEAPNVFVIPV